MAWLATYHDNFLCFFDTEPSGWPPQAPFTSKTAHGKVKINQLAWNAT